MQLSGQSPELVEMSPLAELGPSAPNRENLSPNLQS